MLVTQVQAPLKRQYIILLLDKTSDNSLKPLHCLTCGNVLLEHYGEITTVLPGQMSAGEKDAVGAPMTLHCKNRYRVFVDGREVRAKCKSIYQVVG